MFVDNVSRMGAYETQFLTMRENTMLSVKKDQLLPVTASGLEYSREWTADDAREYFFELFHTLHTHEEFLASPHYSLFFDGTDLCSEDSFTHGGWRYELQIDNEENTGDILCSIDWKFEG